MQKWTKRVKILVCGLSNWPFQHFPYFCAKFAHAMKIIHTADWHIGQDFYHYDRREEHQHFFRQLSEIVAREQPDALLVSGDVYHTSTPSNASVRLYTENMVRLHQCCPTMRIVVTAGNHDSPARLESTGDLWKMANVDVVGSIDYDAENDHYDPDHNIIEISGKGFVVAIPYINRRYNAVFPRMFENVAERNARGLPVVVMGHLAVSGCDLTGHDPRIVGGMESLILSDLGDGYDYLAFGHIHRPQTLDERVRYSGSPLHVSFDENYPHTVSIVELEKHGSEPIIREERICQLMHTYTVPKEALPFEEALNELLHFQPEGSGYVRLNIKVKDYAPTNAETHIREALAGKPELKFCYIRTEYEKRASATEKSHFGIAQIKEINPLDIALAAYRERFGHEMDAEKREMLRKIVNEAISPVGATDQ